MMCHSRAKTRNRSKYISKILASAGKSSRHQVRLTRKREKEWHEKENIDGE